MLVPQRLSLQTNFPEEKVVCRTVRIPGGPKAVQFPHIPEVLARL